MPVRNFMFRSEHHQIQDDLPSIIRLISICQRNSNTNIYKMIYPALLDY
uniref:Uncharacterized protein n=1 Tax=Arundo donax TaxID=35708 RepID=A0A0A9HU55_ARUDO